MRGAELRAGGRGAHSSRVRRRRCAGGSWSSSRSLIPSHSESTRISYWSYSSSMSSFGASSLTTCTRSSWRFWMSNGRWLSIT